MAEWLAESLVSDDALRAAVLGDLAEDFAFKVESGSVRSARRWYWSQVLRSVIPLAWTSLRIAGLVGVMQLAASIVVGYAVLVALIYGTNFWFISPLPDFQSRGIGMIVACAASGIGAGFAAAFVGRRTPMLAALTLGVVTASFSAMGAISLGGRFGQPIWYLVVMMLLIIPCSVFGASIRLLQLRRDDRRILGRHK